MAILRRCYDSYMTGFGCYQPLLHAKDPGLKRSVAVVNKRRFVTQARHTLVQLLAVI